MEKKPEVNKRTRAKVLLDTDIGSDIDDAICLAYLLENPECRLMGITTVSGEATKRANIASAMCRVKGVDVPVFPGTESPLIVTQRQAHSPQAAVLDMTDLARSYSSVKAVEFMRDTIHKNPGEIFILTIGPLTNVALLFALDPQIPSLLGGLVTMGGSFFSDISHTGSDHKAEWNFLCDPHAAAIVFRNSPENTRVIGLDVTMELTMEAEKVRRSFAGSLLEFVVKLAEVRFKNRNAIIFHDPLAAVSIFRQDVCEYRKGLIDIEVYDRDRLGVAIFDSKIPKIDVAYKVSSKKFFEEFFSVFKSPEK